MKLEALSAHAIQDLYNSLGLERDGKHGLSPSTVKIVHGVLHQALKQAMISGYIRFNPTVVRKLPRIEQKEIVPLDKENKNVQLLRCGYSIARNVQIALITLLFVKEYCL